MRTILILCAALICAFPAAADEAPRRAVVGLYLTDITHLDERAETFTADFDVIVRWRDPARSWSPGPGERESRLFVGAAAEQELAAGWRPSLFVVNAHAAGGEHMQRLLVAPDGTVTLRLEAVRTLRSPFDFRAFPFDRQALPVHVESILWDAAQLDLAIEQDFSGFDPDFSMSEWRVVELATDHRIHERLQEGRAYDRLEFTVLLERRSGYYVWKIMLPMVIIVLLSWIVFWMSGEALGRRAGVSATGMLTVIAYQFVVAGTLPRFPYLTVMDHFTISSLVVIAATMLVNLVGSRLEPAACLRLDRVCRGVFPAAYVVVVGYVLLRSGG